MQELVVFKGKVWMELVLTPETGPGAAGKKKFPCQSECIRQEMTADSPEILTAETGARVSGGPGNLPSSCVTVPLPVMF